MPSTNGHGFTSDAGRVGLYLRVSSLEQREMGTIETQREYLERYAASRGFEIADTYADDGVPGTIPFHERTEGQRVLEEAKAGKCQARALREQAHTRRTRREAHERQALPPERTHPVCRVREPLHGTLGRERRQAVAVLRLQ